MRNEDMAETKMIAFSLREIAELFVEKQAIHEVLWGIYGKLGIAAANVEQKQSTEESPTGTHNVLPAAIVPILELGIQRFDSPNSLTVDAAKVSPAPKTSKRTRKNKQKT